MFPTNAQRRASLLSEAEKNRQRAARVAGRNPRLAASLLAAATSQEELATLPFLAG